MREDVLHIQRAREPVRVVHLSNGAICVGREVKEIVRKPQRVGHGVRRRIGMNVDDGFPAFKFLEQRLQGRVSEIDAVRIGKGNKTIELKGVQRVREILQGGIDIW
jgi:hypothetical protein